jgi:hypothetical protein
MSGVNDIIDAIQSGDSVAIDDAFNKEMSARVSERLDTMRQDVAQNMFKSAESVDLDTDVEAEDMDLEAAPMEDAVEAQDELDIEVQDTADTPIEEPAPDVETEEQEV